jgi:murein DD-endopeptidase MepM/ murein hydrolase activator NlpD
MTRRSRVLLNFLLMTTLFLSFAGWCASEEDLQTQIDQTKKKLSQAKQKENSVLGNLLMTQQELDKINSNLDRLGSNLGKTVQRVELVKSQFSNALSELENLQNQISSCQGVLDRRLVAIYKYGYQSYLEVIFTARNFGELISRFEMVGDYIEGDIHMLETLKKQQRQINQKKKEIANKQEELEQQKSAFARLQNLNKQEQNRYLSKVQDTQKELSDIQNDRKRYEDALDEMDEISKSMESQIRDFQNKSRTALGSGKFIWPAPGTVTSEFGYRFHPILWKRKYHTGLDISAPMSTPIVAADTGVVIFSGRNGGYGKMIAIDHGAEMSSVYGHCSELLVTVGQTVTKGQLIAKVGSTGLSTGPHVHFELRKDGIPVDPMNFL